MQGIDKDAQRLNYAGKILEYYRTIKDYNIKKEHNIFMVLKW